ncbi:MAG: hypothetical protein WC776_05245 [Patescibacteria group bacterium]|jgi:hypothetical protein
MARLKLQLVRNSQVTSKRPINLARGHILALGRWLPLPSWNYSFLQGAGGIVSNVRDLWKWNAGLSKFFAENPNFVPPYYGTETKFRYGYGWNAVDRLVTHGGETPGFCVYTAKNLASNSIAIVTLNSDFCLDGDIQDKMNDLVNSVVEAP